MRNPTGADGEEPDPRPDLGYSDEEPQPRPELWSGDEATFRVPLPVIVAKGVLVVALATLSLFASGPTETAVGLFATAGTTVYALRDIIGRDRLRVTRDGVTVVRGYARRQEVAWSQIERFAVDQRLRAFARSEYLEIDAGNDIFMFSRYDLGVHPDVAAGALAAIRPA
ncbi:MAG TPA: PH domain-containing protein [Micromonosporaceae bacterium]